MNIKELKSSAAGTEIKGLPLMIKTARNTFRDAEGTTFQEVVFMDSSGEMTGNILLEVSESDSKGYRNVSEFITWKSKTSLVPGHSSTLPEPLICLITSNVSIPGVQGL